VVVGSGLEPVEPSNSGNATSLETLSRLGVTPPFVLYLGRVDPNKGCETLVKHFIRFTAEYPHAVQLVLAGPINMPMTRHPAVRALGFVDDAVRAALLAHATLMVVPSRFESLSLALLEGWNHGVAALVNGHCSVLKGQALRSDGALFYHNYDEFAASLERLLTNDGMTRQLGAQGLAYVEREYRWPHVIARIEDLLSRVRA
jgi:glycosyltransferase involved in cell wall biosynthesis